MQATQEVHYSKPNMAALHGEWGRKIIDTIRNTPKADFTELDKKCDEIVARIRAAKEDGTY